MSPRHPPLRRALARPVGKLARVDHLSSCLIGNLLCLRCQRRNRPGRDCQRRKGHAAKEGGIYREMAGSHGQRRPSQGGPRKPTRPAPSCIERPSQPGGETRFSWLRSLAHIMPMRMGRMAPPPLSRQTSRWVRQSPLRRAGPEVAMACVWIQPSSTCLRWGWSMQL